MVKYGVLLALFAPDFSAAGGKQGVGERVDVVVSAHAGRGSFSGRVDWESGAATPASGSREGRKWKTVRATMRPAAAAARGRKK